MGDGHHHHGEFCELFYPGRLRVVRDDPGDGIRRAVTLPGLRRNRVRVSSGWLRRFASLRHGRFVSASLRASGGTAWESSPDVSVSWAIQVAGGTHLSVGAGSVRPSAMTPHAAHGIAFNLNWGFYIDEERSLGMNGFAILAIITIAFSVGAQDIGSLQTPTAPLVLQAQGSFYVGGDKVQQTAAQLGSFGPAGSITVNQMYVRYMVPKGGHRKPSVVMIHGATLTGKSWETTPDGRMGWDEYFVRKGHPVYVPDQVARGRSGFNQATFNDVRAGTIPPARQSPMWRFSDEVVWPNFRFGTRPGVPYADEQFPVSSVDELSKQSIPDLNTTLPPANPSYKALAELAARLKNTVLMGHSQGGRFPPEAALIDPAGVKGMVLVEPGSCPVNYSDAQIAVLAKIPTLVLFGDHLADTPTGMSALPSWQIPFDGCKAFIARVNAAGGNAQMLYPPDQGIRGNSHMIMQDRNSLQIADLVLKWIDATVSRKRGS